MERERITISIKKKLLKEIDKTIDGLNVRNRSHAIETLSSVALNKCDVKNAVILIGGTNAIKTIPGAIDALGKLQKNNFNKVYIALGYLADKIKDKLDDVKYKDLNLSYLEGGEGSAGAFLPLKKSLTSTFIVFNTSYATKINIDDILEFHRKYSAIATVATNDFSDFEGIYIFEPSIFNYIKEKSSMLEVDVLPKLIEENKLIAFPQNI
jgi:NDP-sugar pyrophosphorylase family protein